MESNKESYNLIITGVGGQGNVLSSELIGQFFISKGYFVTIGETYGASQRGGAVMSHIRISQKRQLSPLIPRGKADVVMALEPVEALRVLVLYGNPYVAVLVNTHPIYPVDATAGNEAYPKIEDIKKTIDNLSQRVYYIDGTKRAMEIGSPILVNMIMIGALVELKLLPINADGFRETLSGKFDKKRLDINTKAFEEGRRTVSAAYSRALDRKEKNR